MEKIERKWLDHDFLYDEERAGTEEVYLIRARDLPVATNRLGFWDMTFPDGRTMTAAKGFAERNALARLAALIADEKAVARTEEERTRERIKDAAPWLSEAALDEITRAALGDTE